MYTDAAEIRHNLVGGTYIMRTMNNNNDNNDVHGNMLIYLLIIKTYT